MKLHHVARFLIFVSVNVIAAGTNAYPLDEYDRTGIARLEFYRLAQAGEISGRQLPEGAKRPASEITLAYPVLSKSGDGHVALPSMDKTLSSAIAEFLADEDLATYGIAVLDYTDPSNPVYAAHNDSYQSNVGSVGKLLAGVAVMNQLAARYPDNIVLREQLLRDTVVVADEYSERDHHRVPIFDVAARKLQHRALHIGDQGSLWEFLDWMFSASSNSAASMVIQQATLMSQLGQDYPNADLQSAWLRDTGWKEEGEATQSALDAGLLANGLDTKTIRQGSYFTRGGKKSAAGTLSYATPRSLVHLLAMLETGTLIDEWSSLEVKRLLYMTQRRIRYASHPALHDSAVYFKSGSLYSCQDEPGYTCAKYKGNKRNNLASIAIIESPARVDDGIPPMRYAVAVMSNVLYKNSAVAHQTLAMRIHRLLEDQHRGTYRPLNTQHEPLSEQGPSPLPAQLPVQPIDQKVMRKPMQQPVQPHTQSAEQLSEDGP